jgi:crotonobetainyl-CoA:carnitine CoA-transferase CaiB-like acyl-CoA transferase
VTADLHTPEGREFLGRLLATADILIHNVAPSERSQLGLDSQELCAEHPGLIVTSISMYGDTGPHAGWHGYELNASNAGGWAFLSPGASPAPDLPPLKAFGAQCDYHAGAYAAPRRSPLTGTGFAPGKGRRSTSPNRRPSPRCSR